MPETGPRRTGERAASFRRGKVPTKKKDTAAGPARQSTLVKQGRASQSPLSLSQKRTRYALDALAGGGAAWASVGAAASVDAAVTLPPCDASARATPAVASSRVAAASSRTALWRAMACVVGVWGCGSLSLYTKIQLWPDRSPRLTLTFSAGV